MVRYQNVLGKEGICLLFFGNKQQDIMSLSQQFIIIWSDQNLCQVAKLIDTIEYMNGREQSTEDPDETVQMHRLTFTFQIQ